MKIDLNTILEEIHSWKTFLKSKDEEIEKLQNQVALTCQQNKVLEETQTTLLKEISQFNNTLSTLHNSISRQENHEVEKKTLLAEKENLKDTLDAQNMLHQVEVEEFKSEIQNLKLAHAKELENHKSEAMFNDSTKVEKYLEKISEKEDDVRKLKEEISNLKSENKKEILGIKIEYEEKIVKLKNRITKPKRPFNDVLQKDDIFRQKYIKIEKESKEEITKLKNEIKDLQSQISSLQSNQLSSNAQTFDNFNSLREEHNKISDYEEQNLPLFKRFKSANEAKDEKDFVLFNVSRNKADLVQPVKKKLFNLDMNYFVK